MNPAGDSARAALSVVILTLNEEINIKACLETLTWADEVIVVDSGSTDRTLALAKETRPDCRVFSHPFQDFGEGAEWEVASRPVVYNLRPEAVVRATATA